jgi:hypothetical protein
MHTNYTFRANLCFSLEKRTETYVQYVKGVAKDENSKEPKKPSELTAQLLSRKAGV